LAPITSPNCAVAGLEILYNLYLSSGQVTSKSLLSCSKFTCPQKWMIHKSRKNALARRTSCHYFYLSVENSTCLGQADKWVFRALCCMCHLQGTTSVHMCNIK
jgi:hypothetical protein